MVHTCNSVFDHVFMMMTTKPIVAERRRKVLPMLLLALLKFCTGRPSEERTHCGTWYLMPKNTTSRGVRWWPWWWWQVPRKAGKKKRRKEAKSGHGKRKEIKKCSSHTHTRMQRVLFSLSSMWSVLCSMFYVPCIYIYIYMCVCVSVCVGEEKCMCVHPITAKRKRVPSVDCCSSIWPDTLNDLTHSLYVDISFSLAVICPFSLSILFLSWEKSSETQDQSKAWVLSLAFDHLHHPSIAPHAL